MYAKFIASFAALALASAVPAQADTHQVGVMNFTHDASHRERLVQSLIYYPTPGGMKTEWVGDNVVFKGVRMIRDAIPDTGEYPLIVMSHGSGGNAANLAWLAGRLAAQGFVVVIPNHQGSTSGDSRPETTIPSVWQRPADISTLLDALLASPSANAMIDETNVTALGFSLGGVTALSLAGVQFQATGLAQFCDAEPAAMGCPWLAHGNTLIPGHVDLHKIDATKFNASYTDARIKRFVAIDPGFAPAANKESLADVAAETLIINLGDAGALPKGVDAGWIAKSMPNARHETVSGATHFDFLSECKPLGWFFIWMDGDDPVCSAGGRSRAEIHDEIATKVLAFLKADAS